MRTPALSEVADIASSAVLSRACAKPFTLSEQNLCHFLLFVRRANKQAVKSSIYLPIKLSFPATTPTCPLAILESVPTCSVSFRPFLCLLLPCIRTFNIPSAQASCRNSQKISRKLVMRFASNLSTAFDMNLGAAQILGELDKTIDRGQTACKKKSQPFRLYDLTVLAFSCNVSSLVQLKPRAVDEFDARSSCGCHPLDISAILDSNSPSS